MILIGMMIGLAALVPFAISTLVAAYIALIKTDSLFKSSLWGLASGIVAYCLSYVLLGAVIQTIVLGKFTFC